MADRRAAAEESPGDASASDMDIGPRERELARLDALKRRMSTPNRNVKKEPGENGGEEAAVKSRSPRRPRLDDEFAAAASEPPAARSSADPDPNGGPVLGAIATMTAQMSSLALAVDNLTKTAATKEDLNSMKTQIVTETKEFVNTQVGAAVAPLKSMVAELTATQKKFSDEVSSLRGRLDDLREVRRELDTVSDTVAPLLSEWGGVRKRLEKVESRPSSSVADTGALDKLRDSLDPARRSVSFLTFPAMFSADQQLEAMKGFLDKFPKNRPLSFFNAYKGPYGNRELNHVGQAEFASEDAAKEFLKAVGARGEVFKAGGVDIAIKPAKTKKNSARDFSLYKAKEMLEKDAPTEKVELDRAGRCVKVSGAVMFTQERDERGGRFSGRFSHLALP